MCLILQSVGCIMYSYMFSIMKYYFCYICFNLCNDMCLSYETLRMTGLDDCNILQPRHLVRSRLGGTHDLISIQNINISRLRMLK
jgi:hypothetical protein